MNISDSLSRHFQKHRIIFWYDDKQELFEQYSQIDIPGVETIEVKGNEFEVKHIITRQKPQQKFLLYFHNPQPNAEENWLLDQELAHYVFQTDQESMFLQEMGLGYHFKELVAEHLEFFKSKERRNKFAELLGADDDHQALRYKMLAVLFGTENVSLVTFVHAHGSAFAQNIDKYDKDLIRFNLSQYYWKEINRKFRYQSDKPSIYDFLIEVFSNNFSLIKKNGLSRESRLLISIWKNTYPFREHFSTLSARIALDLGVEEILSKAQLEDVINDELFELTDKKIIFELVSSIEQENQPKEKIHQYIKQRENKFWHDQYRHFYASLSYAAEMIHAARKYEALLFDDFMQGIEEYATRLYVVDMHYRKFIFSYRQTNQSRILSSLAAKVERVYSNDWLLGCNNQWQKTIDKLESWPTPLYKSQQDFFKTHITPAINKDQRLFVIISDALRFEAAAELQKMLQAEKRFNAENDHMLSLLPSYTQLGMAALLPHQKLSWSENSDTVLVDGISSAGAAARAKILTNNAGVKATAVTAEDFMRMNANTEGREFVKQYQLIYIYHNRIDKVGDDKTTEEKVFEAVESEQLFLIELLRKIYNMNGYNMIITSDHGFIYQHDVLDESDFSMAGYEGEIWKENRRFVIGRNIKSDNKAKHFSEKQIGMNAEVLIPKSINRLRIKGSGSRFIHGGASLQEIVVPVLKVSVKRKETTSYVDVDIIKTTDRITTNILAVSFIQSVAASSNVLARTIQAAIYTENNELLSDIFTYNFNMEADSARQREVKHRFQLSSKASGKYKNTKVKLILKEPVEDSSKWKEIKSFDYTLNISFTSDFDD